MNYFDSRWMLRGKHKAYLTKPEWALTQPFEKTNGKRHKALLMLHGFSSSPAAFRLITSALPYYDAVICPVLAGHAQSIQEFSLSTVHDWRATAFNTCESLVKKYQKVDVLGLSLGGILACELSQRFELNQLFLLAPAFELPTSARLLLKIARLARFLGFKEIRNHAGRLNSELHEEIAYRKLPLAAVIEVLELIVSHNKCLPSCPTDVFLGADDPVVDSEDIKKLFMGAPNVTIHWLENSAHLLPLDNDVLQIVECINRRASELKRA